ncbi:MAG TPA: alpha-glucan family phosphorylase, partial [Chitinophagaceae bacterium]|nr:alpha-glucan family phosphorylase [Chitinophagaceae bacterium]
MHKPIKVDKDELIHYLYELAMDLHWSWNHATDKVWRQLDAVLWDLTHNPLVVLQTVSNDRIGQVLQDPIVREIIEELIEAKRQRAVAPAWFQKTYPHTSLTSVAYFSMEFMLSEALPIYSGGLGNVCGDHLKTASDLGVPITGVGLLYQQGYPRQVIYTDGMQHYVAPYNEPGQLPITPLRYPNGEWLRIEVKLPGYSVWLRTWEVQVGRIRLLLLDSNDAANFPVHRGITSELYGGDAELRLLQELILGIGGWRLLRALNLQPQVCHLNEGHTAFVILERALHFMVENKVSFDEALMVTRSGNVFTTHTAIGAGFDQFHPSLMDKYLG